MRAALRENGCRPSRPEAGRQGASPAERPRCLLLRHRTLPLGERTLVMGILNVTPDSFYDGGRYRLAEEAVERGLCLAGEGADIIDVGGESSRPGAEPVDAEEEWRRVGPVIEKLAARGLVVSADTYKSSVAGKALAAGAAIINDISGGTMDPALHRTAAEYGAGLVIMHIKGTPRTMQLDPTYRDLMGEILSFLRDRADAALQAGVRPESIIIDPGIGFGKSPEHNLRIIRRLGELRRLPYPVLAGASRKSFLGFVGGLPPEERLEGSIGAAAAAAIYGADILRVHDVRETARALAVVDAIRRQGD